ncbi:hypothetical protein [Shimia biformata]|uniref:hypothetical protein n=1 Tax=Shimia biformata TaxID=1294299 RepID=UPI00194EA78D|nr:hypothetical protein [Shimia biformata]
MKDVILKMTMGLGLMAMGADLAHAQGNNCAPRDVVLERLTGDFGETRRSVGLGNNNVVVEVFASEETGSWSITVTLPDGRTCLVAAGESYQELAEALPKPGKLA